MSSVGGVSTQSYYNRYDYGNIPKAGANNKGGAVKNDATIQGMWDKVNAATQSLKDMVEKMLSTSSKNGAKPGQGFWAVRANPDQFNITVDEGTRAEAESMIGEEGFYGVKQTSERIMNFAKALGGENADSETIQKLREASLKAFDEVAKMFGGFENLPEVTQRTYDAVVKGFDEWEASLAA